MCKKGEAEFCSELGKDSSLWSANAPLEKPDWIKDSFQILVDAITQASTGKVDLARSILKNSRELEMRTWYHVHAQNVAKWRFDTFKIETPEPILPLDPENRFSKFERKLFARDNYKCRYCTDPVVPKKVFEKAQSLIGSTDLPLGRTNLTRSGFYLMFAATLDHVIPWSLGGRTDESNLVTSCWSCNYGKANFTVEQIGIENPFNTTLEPDPQNRVAGMLNI
jgi:5-methylcytosine-specific restriction endonuclease McrA